MKVMLQHVAHCRSGDKGNTSNISVIAYAPELYRCIKDQLTEARFKDFYAGVVTGPVQLRCRRSAGRWRIAQSVPRQLRQIPVGAHSCIRTGRSRRSGIALAWNGLICGLRRTANHKQFFEESVASGPSARSRTANDETYQIDRRGVSEHVTPQSGRAVAFSTNCQGLLQRSKLPRKRRHRLVRYDRGQPNREQHIHYHRHFPGCSCGRL